MLVANCTQTNAPNLIELTAISRGVLWISPQGADQLLFVGGGTRAPVSGFTPSAIWTWKSRKHTSQRWCANARRMIRMWTDAYVISRRRAAVVHPQRHHNVLDHELLPALACCNFKTSAEQCKAKIRVMRPVVLLAKHVKIGKLLQYFLLRAAITLRCLTRKSGGMHCQRSQRDWSF